MTHRTVPVLLAPSLALLLAGACSDDSGSDSAMAASNTGVTNSAAVTSTAITSSTSSGETATVATSAGGATSTTGSTTGSVEAGSLGGAAGETSTTGDVFAMQCPDQPDDLFAAGGSGGTLEPGPEVASTPTRPQLTATEADELFSIQKALFGGGQFTATFSGAEGEPLGERSISYEREDSWDPVAAPIADVSKIVPGLTVAADGSGTHTTVQAAVSAAVLLAGCERVYIRVMPGTYREKILVPDKTSAPPITLYSTEADASQTLIVRGDSAAGDEVSGTVLKISQAATFTQSLPRGFQAKNLTIANDYVEGTWPGDEQAAPALLNQGDQAQYENVRILGNIHSLYVKSTDVYQASRTYFRDSYIEGDDEFILGRGTAVFDHCEIHALGARAIADAAVAAPSTLLDNPHGFLFINSEFTADDGVTDVYMGRQWNEGENLEAVGKIVVRNSILGAHLQRADPWAAILRLTPQEPEAMAAMVLYDSEDYYAPETGLVPPELYVGEYGNSGPGAATQ